MGHSLLVGSAAAVVAVVGWLACFAGNLLLARYHAALIEKAIKTGSKRAILHGAWAAVYGLFCAGLTFIPAGPDKVAAGLYFGALLALHGCIFSAGLNLYRGFTAYNLSTTSRALFDRALVRLGFKNTRVVTWVILAGSIGLLTAAVIRFAGTT